MSSVNKVILVGRLGKDPQIHQFQNGGKITTLSIATSERWTDKNTGERRENTEWHTAICHDRLADIAAQYLAKGAMVYIEGSLHTRKWTDNNNIERYTTEIRVRELRMLSSQNQAQNQGYQAQNQGYQPQNQGYQAPQNAPRQYPDGMMASPDTAMQRPPQNTYQNAPMANDDIPF